MIIDKNDMWRWGFSSFLNNAMRGVVAEYIVGQALGALSDNRVEWDAYDLETQSGIKIEVKASGYVQEWTQRKPSKISFDIAKKLWWDAKNSRYTNDFTRPSDIYCFCIHEEMDENKANPLDTDQWSFIVVPTKKINDLYGEQKSITLGRLLSSGFYKISYDELANQGMDVTGKPPVE